MEDEKKFVNLDEGKLEQVVGGSQKEMRSYTDCPAYKVLQESKTTEPETVFIDTLKFVKQHDCPRFKNEFFCTFDCDNCPAECEWSQKYGG